MVGIMMTPWLFRGEHEAFRRTTHAAHGLAPPEALEHVGHVLEADEQVVDQRRVARLFGNATEDLRRDERLDHEAAPPRALRIEHQEVAEDRADLVAVEVEPRAVLEARLHADPVGVGIAR
jgi:hypothetical protein